MFNFNGTISKFQIDRFKAIQGFLGGCVMNIGDLARSITTLVGVQSHLDGCATSVKKAQTDESNMLMFRGLYAPIDAARVISEKMMEASVQLLMQSQITGTMSMLRSMGSTLQGEGRESFSLAGGQVLN